MHELPAHRRLQAEWDRISARALILGHFTRLGDLVAACPR